MVLYSKALYCELSLIFRCILLLLLDACRRNTESILEAKTWRSAFIDIFLKHSSLSKELQSHQDIDAKNKAKLRRLRGNYSAK